MSKKGKSAAATEAETATAKSAKSTTSPNGAAADAGGAAEVAKSAESTKSAKSAKGKDAKSPKDEAPDSAGQSEKTQPADDGAAQAAAKSPHDALIEYSAEQLRDMYLRAVADSENIKRRAEQDMRKVRDFTLSQFAHGICGVRDSAGQSEKTQPADDGAAQAAAKSPHDALIEYSAEQLRDMYLRAVADSENIKRRAEQDMRKVRDFTLSQFAHGICGVRDSLEAALAAENDDNPMHEGVSLTLRNLILLMENNGIRTIKPDVGASFDVSLHQAISTNPEPGKTPNTIAAVVMCGYTLNGRLVRPAQIIVYKPDNTPPAGN